MTDYEKQMLLLMRKQVKETEAMHQTLSVLVEVMIQNRNGISDAEFATIGGWVISQFGMEKVKAKLVELKREVGSSIEETMVNAGNYFVDKHGLAKVRQLMGS